MQYNAIIQKCKFILNPEDPIFSPCQAFLIVSCNTNRNITAIFVKKRQLDMNERIVSAKIQVYTFGELSEVEKKLIKSAQEATERAYAPYSGFQVGAAALLDNGEIVTGNNQENAAYPSGLCAERVTLFYANSQYPNSTVKMIAITAQTGGNFTTECTAPCGACRQVILETENRFDTPIRILMAGRETVYAVDSIKELLPLHFDKASLNG
jgi:cytidine deaminase